MPTSFGTMLASSGIRFLQRQEGWLLLTWPIAHCQPFLCFLYSVVYRTRLPSFSKFRNFQKIMGLRLSVAVRLKIYSHISIDKSFQYIHFCLYDDDLSAQLSFRYACWIQCHLWTHYQHSEWNSGRWLFSCSLMHCLFLECLLLSHTWQTGGTCFSRWDRLFILFWFIILPTLLW